MTMHVSRRRSVQQRPGSWGSRRWSRRRRRSLTQQKCNTTCLQPRASACVSWAGQVERVAEAEDIGAAGGRVAEARNA